MSFGEFIEMMIWYKHLNKTELAKAMGTSATSIDRLINEPIKLAPMKMKKLSEIMDIPLEILFMWQGHELANRYKEDEEE